MAFINEYINEEDKKRYELDALWGKYNGFLSQKLPKKQDWTIDRDRDIWLMDTGRLPHPDMDHAYASERIWTLHYKGVNIEVRIEVSLDKVVNEMTYKRVWNLLSLTPSSLENLSTDSLIALLHEALKTYGYMGIASQRPDFTVALRDRREGFVSLEEKHDDDL